jgi:hypothetical protein
MLEHVRSSLTAQVAAAATALQGRIDAQASARAAMLAVQAQVAPAQDSATRAEQDVFNRQTTLAAAQAVVGQRDAERNQALSARDAAARNVANIAGAEPIDIFPNGKPNPAYLRWREKLRAAQGALDQATTTLGVAQASLSQALPARDSAAASLGAAVQARDAAQAQLAGLTNAVLVAQQQVAATDREVAAAQQLVDEAQAALAVVDARLARLTAEPVDRRDLAEAADREYEALSAARSERHGAWSRRAELLRRRTVALDDHELAVAAVRNVLDEITVWPDSSDFALPPLHVDGGHGLRNPGFEDGTVGWQSRLPGQNLQVYRSPAAKEGDWYAEINNGSADVTTGPSLYQDVPADARPGQTFAFSVWVRSADGQPYTGTVALWGLGGVNEPGSTRFTAAGSWTEISAELHVANEGHYALRAEIYMGTADRNLDLDGARLVEVRAGARVDLPTDLEVAGRRTAEVIRVLGAVRSRVVADRDAAAAQLSSAATELAQHERDGRP